ncbi:sterol desaturase-like protein [Nostoc sp. NIES-4103]|nr:sterol desaturase-like protein [Nostoc sp. NIES-4103]
MKQLLINWLEIFLFGAVLWLWEIADPRTEIKYITEYPKELLNWVARFLFDIILTLGFAYCLQFLFSPMLLDAVANTGILSLPLWVRVIICYLLSDFTYYLIHRAMHSYQFLWLTHKWHHSIDVVWWLAGMRVSFMSLFLLRFAVLWVPLLQLPIETLIVMILYSATTHVNVKSHPWMGIMEWIFVTPRFHCIHHCSSTKVQGKNLGGMFTFFDRIFGTYVNPETINVEEEKFGLGDEQITAKMIVGI